MSLVTRHAADRARPNPANFVERPDQGRTDAVNRRLRVGVSQATFCAEGLVGSTERKRVRNYMYTKLGEHNLQGSLGFHAAEQSGRG
jgi:hypothetical protein